jgi:hypothetical protein
MLSNVNSEFLMKMFELYKETNSRTIEALNDELKVCFMVKIF